MKINKLPLVAALASALLLGGPVQAELEPSNTKDLIVVQVQNNPDQLAMAQITAPRDELTVTAWVDHQDNTYRPGDNLELFVKANEDAYITVLDVGTSGKVHIIYPNQHQTNNFVRKDQVVRIPGRGDVFDFRVGGPAGNELIKVFATTGPTPIVDQRITAIAGSFRSVNKKGAMLAKDIEVVLTEHAQQGNRWDEYDKVIRIVD